MSLSAADLVERLQLIAHPEGGFFREVYRSGAEPMASRGATDAAGQVVDAFAGERRNLMTSIYWMPTKESPIGWLCSNRADHIHYHHAGASLTYYLVSPKGRLQIQRLGCDLARGDVMQLIVPGGYWKAAHLEEGDYCLLGEAVAPGFDFRDFRFVSEDELLAQCPQHDTLRRFVKPNRRRDFERYYEK